MDLPTVHLLQAICISSWRQGFSEVAWKGSQILWNWMMGQGGELAYEAIIDMIKDISVDETISHDIRQLFMDRCMQSMRNNDKNSEEIGGDVFTLGIIKSLIGNFKEAFFIFFFVFVVLLNFEKFLLIVLNIKNNRGFSFFFF